MWICPICNRPLQEQDNGFRCDKNHSFDKSRSGYVHLVPAHRMHGKVPGDNKLMVDARRRFLGQGYYEPLAQEISDCVCRYVSSGNLLDIGCGEGYYTGYIHQSLMCAGRSVYCYGIDISKIAVERAAKSYQDIPFAVGSAFHLPIATDACSCVLNLFAPYCGEEISRVLLSDGYFIMAIPGRDHLWELKQVLYEKPYKNEVKPFELEGFNLVKKRELQYRISLTDVQTIYDLFSMTPYYYKTGREDQGKLQNLSHLSVTAHFHVLVYRAV